MSWLQMKQSKNAEIGCRQMPSAPLLRRILFSEYWALVAGLCLISWIGVSPSLVFQFSRYASDLLKILLYHCTVPLKNEDEPCLLSMNMFQSVIIWDHLLMKVQSWAPTCSMNFVIQLGLYAVVFQLCLDSSLKVRLLVSLVNPDFQFNSACPLYHLNHVQNCCWFLLADFTHSSPGYHIYFQTGWRCTMICAWCGFCSIYQSEIKSGKQSGEHEIDKIQQSVSEQLATVDIDATHAKWHSTHQRENFSKEEKNMGGLKTEPN